jgi:hypothetical protein
MIKTLFPLLLLCLLSIFFSCKKTTSDDKLGALDLTGGYALIVPEYPDNSSLRPDETADFAKLYKITQSDTLQIVKYLSTLGTDMGYAYVPEAVYDLNASYMFLTLSRKDKVPKEYESYLIQKSSGNATEIYPEFHPKKFSNGVLVDDDTTAAFHEGASNYFYCFDDQKIDIIHINSASSVDISSVTIPSVSSSDFTVDKDGNIYIQGKIITSSSVLDISGYQDGKSFVSKSLSSGFYLATLKDTSVEINQLTIENNALKTILIKDIGKGSDTWAYKGSAILTNLSSAFLVFDKGIINITPSETKIVPLSWFSLNSINLVNQSSKNFYITGSNVLDKEVFMLINPTSTPPAYTQTLPPNSYSYKKINVTTDNIVTFFATHISDSREVFGYIPESSNVMIRTNYQALKVKRIVAYK